MADESNSLRVRLVSPERILFDTTADAVELPAKNGYMEVLYGHAPLLAELGAGDVRLHGGRRRRRADLQRDLGIRRGAAGPRHDSGQRCVEARGDRCAARASSNSIAARRSGTRPATAKRHTTEALHRHRRSRSQDWLRRRRSIKKFRILRAEKNEGPARESRAFRAFGTVGSSFGRLDRRRFAHDPRRHVGLLEFAVLRVENDLAVKEEQYVEF